MSALDDELAQAYQVHGETPTLLAVVDGILASHAVDDARTAFERAGARDVLGREADAVPLYREALDRGLSGPERLQCLIQLASSLRNLGRAEEAVHLLRGARADADGDGRDWVDAFLALSLHSHGHCAEALAVALGALAPHLTRYGRAVASYAEELAEPPRRPSSPDGTGR